MGRNWEDFGPRPPWGCWVAGGWPRGRASVPRHRRACIAGAARTSHVTPASGERSNPHPQQQQGRPHLRASGAPRQVEQADHPPHAQLAAPLHVRAHIAHRARTAGVARRRPWNSRFREAKQEEPTSATTGTSATCVVRLACAACMRGAACAAARRPPRRAARVCVSVGYSRRITKHSFWCLVITA